MRPLFERFRNRTYTGERRCWPCTAANLLVLLFGCVAVARRRSRWLAAALGVCGMGAIALRGYLVPYTPKFAPRIAARLPGDPFHTNREERDTPDSPGSLGGETDEETGEQVLAALLERGVAVADGETVYLAEDFREAWRAKMRDLRKRDDEGLAVALREAAPEGTVAEIVEQDGGRFGERKRWFVVSDGSGDPARERWLTRPIAVAEAGAVRALVKWGGESGRTKLSPTRRAQAAGPLRTFLESCPVCDGPVEETTVVECCGGPGGARADAPDEVLACGECDSRLYTFR